MPNWCYNQTVFYGDKETTTKLYKELKEVIDYRTNCHIDNFFKLLGVPQERLNVYYGFRGYIGDFCLLEDNSLMLSYETAWNPIIEGLNDVLAEYQPTLKQVTWCEECGMAVYINTDREGLYFKHKYYLDMSTEGGNDFNDEKYFDTLDDAINEFQIFYGVYDDITTEEELRKEISKVRDRYDDDVYITFEEFTDY